MSEEQADQEAPQAAAGRESDINVVGGHPPRRVVLRHDDTGNYVILMGNRLIQGFCQEFEEITGYAIGVNTQQQVHIRIDPIGRRQHARYPDRGEDTPQIDVEPEQPLETQIRVSQGEGALFTTSRTWRDEAREHLVRDIQTMQNMIDLLGRM